MSNINVQVAEVNDAFFNPRLADNPCVSRYNLRKADFANTMTDIYEFMGDLNVMSVERGWGRFEDMLQLQALSNVLSNLLNSTMAKHSRELVVNTLPNGHPDLIRTGIYPNNLVAEAEDGVEMKATETPEQPLTCIVQENRTSARLYIRLTNDEMTPVCQSPKDNPSPSPEYSSDMSPKRTIGIMSVESVAHERPHFPRMDYPPIDVAGSISPTSYAERYGQDAVSIFQCCEFRNRIAGKIVVFGVSFNAKA